MSVKETNPGTSMMDKDDIMFLKDDDDTEEVINLDIFPESTEILKTSCVKCGSVGDIVKVHMQKKHELLIYGKAGIRKDFHNKFRSNFRNADKTCQAGYYHGYKTYQGMKIVENDALNKKYLLFQPIVHLTLSTWLT